MSISQSFSLWLWLTHLHHRLEKEKQRLQAERNEAAKINKQKKAELMRLEQDLKSVIRAARPIGVSLDKFLA